MWQLLDKDHEVCFETMEVRVVSSGKVYTIRRTFNIYGTTWHMEQQDGLVLGAFLLAMMYETKLELMYLTWVIEKDLLT